MKAVMLSIKPKYCELIASGKKIVEVRKTRPNIDTPFKSYIYCTKGKFALLRDDEDKSERYKRECWNRAIFHEKCGKTILNCKVIGEFVCDKIYQYTTCDIKDGVDISDEDMTRLSCLTKDEIKDYELSPGKFGVFGWHISDLVIYDKPKELSEFYRYCGDNPKCENCPFVYFESNESIGTYEECSSPIEEYCKPLTCPPQSWCYVEEE